jgi:hypothetical protein
VGYGRHRRPGDGDHSVFNKIIRDTKEGGLRQDLGEGGFRAVVKSGQSIILNENYKDNPKPLEQALSMRPHQTLDIQIQGAKGKKIIQVPGDKLWSGFPFPDVHGYEVR